MKPFLDRLPDDAARAEFEAEVLKQISPFYPAQADGRVLFPFKRIFSPFTNEAMTDPFMKVSPSTAAPARTATPRC
jgi:hypothetical protein